MDYKRSDWFGTTRFSTTDFKPAWTQVTTNKMIAKCPVCEGAGTVFRGLYSRVTQDRALTTCRSCAGKGYIKE